MKGRIISVPSNYDPTTRDYTGTWDGTFKSEWTDNPAWVYYDICTNDRFGLGNLIDSS
jgi:predicted phage tail protein